MHSSGINISQSGKNLISSPCSNDLHTAIDLTVAAAALDALWVYWAWKLWNHRRKGRPKYLWLLHPRGRKRGKRVSWRISCLIIPALLISAAFAVADIFASHIAAPA